ncbi:hypothetical protein BV25DRAFT_1146104 [Artomyces pyxidatus]|uniref:Uncharacterized protein n=2 Tax=Artomyces pyxidatus TaxID=48021 RepID=A0ACB8SSE5_9AGAM|nr:hypothetical protein BV25DRAFT_1208878 [Artomyces pyxidatus]KAI0059148.1 hypothetical protein BV25DRAFT_1146104 [Artomyces pyxidatus]
MDATTTVVNTGTQFSTVSQNTITTPSRRSAQDPLPDAPPSRRQRTSTSSRTGTVSRRAVTVPLQAVPGVGPPSRPATTSQRADNLEPTSLPAHLFGTFVRSDSGPETSMAVASDVWYCTYPLKSGDRPSALPEMELYKSKPPVDKYSHLWCRFCPLDDPTTGPPWKNVNGQTAAIRSHLLSKHRELYRKIVVLYQLKGWKDIVQEDAGTLREQRLGHKDREPFSIEGFYERLIRWIVVDDQSISVIDSPELRDLLLFVGIELVDGEIPHRTKLTQMIFERCHREYASVVAEIRVS